MKQDNGPTSINEARTPTRDQVAKQSDDLNQQVAEIKDASTKKRKREMSPGREKEIARLKEAAGNPASGDKASRRKFAAKKTTEMELPGK